jgi:DNA-directed RNA polymerase subunit F
MKEENVLESKPISLVNVKEILKERKAEAELNYEQELTLKYVEKFAKMTKKQADDLITALNEISFLKDQTELIFQLAYTLPTTIDQVKLFVPKDVEATDEELKKVLELTKKFGEKI